MMVSPSMAGMPSMSTLFSAYATISAFITLFQQAFNQIVPQRVQDYLYEKLEQWFNKSKLRPSSNFTFVIEQPDDSYCNYNQVFDACEKYLCSKLSNFANRLKVTRQRAEDILTFSLAEGQEFKEVFEGVEFTWNYVISSKENNEHQSNQERRHFELTIEKKHKDKALNSYLPFVFNFYNEMQEKQKELKLHTLDKFGGWHEVDFKHPFTFDSLAMDPIMKRSITNDLDRFIKRKEFYKRVGKAWKRGYLLYGPPGTGKSSLIAAMANHLKFDIYDLQLSRVEDDAALRNLMLWTSNKSILVIEDIDCCCGLPSRRENIEGCSDEDESEDGDEDWSSSKISLSGLLNFLDGLWSSCGDERIIIFTTNQKDKLDPALLRPGRMDMHIHMSYLTMPGFRILASNYLDISDEDYPVLFRDIESLIQTVNITAAQVAEEMLRSENDEIALQGVIEILNQKKYEGSKIKKNDVLSMNNMDNESGKKENNVDNLDNVGKSNST